MERVLGRFVQVPSGCAQHGLVQRGRNEDAFLRKLSQRRDKLGWRLKVLVILPVVVPAYLHLQRVKRVGRRKGSAFEEFFCAFIVAQNFERIVESGFHSAEGNADGLGDFSQTEAIHETKQQNFAMLL